MDFLYFTLVLAVVFLLVGYILDFYLVRTGRVVNKSKYTIDDIKEIKSNGFLYYSSARKRMSKVPEVQVMGYKARQKFFSDL